MVGSNWVQRFLCFIWLVGGSAQLVSCKYAVELNRFESLQASLNDLADNLDADSPPAPSDETPEEGSGPSGGGPIDVSTTIDYLIKVKNPVNVEVGKVGVFPHGFPISTGIFFPINKALSGLGALAVYDNIGNRVPADFEAVAWYPTGKIKRVRVTFFVKLSAYTGAVSSGVATFRLKNDVLSGGGNTSLSETPILLNTTADSYEITTDGRFFKFSKKRFQLENMFYDQNNDGTYSSLLGEQMINNTVATDSMCLKKAPLEGGVVACDSQSEADSVSVVHHGHNLVVLKYDKKAHSNPQNNGYTAYVEIYRGGFAKVSYRIDYAPVGESALLNPYFFESLEMKNQVMLPGNLMLQSSSDGNLTSKSLTGFSFDLRQKSHDVSSLVMNGAEASWGQQMDGWVSIDNGETAGSTGMFVFNRFFWKQWPNGFNYSSNKFTISLFPSWSSQLLMTGALHAKPGAGSDGLYWLAPRQSSEKTFVLLPYRAQDLQPDKRVELAKVLEYPPVGFQDLTTFKSNTLETTAYGAQVPPLTAPLPESVNQARTPVYSGDLFNISAPDKYNFSVFRFGGQHSRCMQTTFTGNSYLRYGGLAKESTQEFYLTEEAVKQGYFNSRPTDYHRFVSALHADLERPDKGPYSHGAAPDSYGYATYDIIGPESYALGGETWPGTSGFQVKDLSWFNTYVAPYASCAFYDSMHDFGMYGFVHWLGHSLDRMSLDYLLGMKEYNKAIMSLHVLDKAKDASGVGRLMAYVVRPVVWGAEYFPNPEDAEVLRKYLEKVHKEEFHQKNLRSFIAAEHYFTLNYFIVSLMEGLDAFPIETSPMTYLELMKDVLMHMQFNYNGGNFAWTLPNLGGVISQGDFINIPTLKQPSGTGPSDGPDPYAGMILKHIGFRFPAFKDHALEYVSGGIDGEDGVAGDPPYSQNYYTSQGDEGDEGSEWEKLEQQGFAKSDMTPPQTITTLNASCTGGVVTVTFQDVSDNSGFVETRRILAFAPGAVTIADLEGFNAAMVSSTSVHLVRTTWMPVDVPNVPGVSVSKSFGGIPSGTYTVGVMSRDGSKNLSKISNQKTIVCP